MTSQRAQEKFSRKIYDWIRANGLKVGEKKAFVCEGQVIIVDKKWEDGAEWSYFCDDSLVIIDKEGSK